MAPHLLKGVYPPSKIMKHVVVMILVQDAHPRRRSSHGSQSGRTGQAKVSASASPMSGEARPRFFMSSLRSSWISLRRVVAVFDAGEVGAQLADRRAARRCCQPVLQVAPHLGALVGVERRLAPSPSSRSAPPPKLTPCTPGTPQLAQAIDHAGADAALVDEDRAARSLRRRCSATRPASASGRGRGASRSAIERASRPRRKQITLRSSPKRATSTPITSGDRQGRRRQLARASPRRRARRR